MEYKSINKTSAKILARLNDTGKTWFNINEAYLMFPDMSENYIRVQLKRMTDNGGQQNANSKCRKCLKQTT